MIIELFGLPGSGKTTALTMIAQKTLQGKNVLNLGKHSKIFTTFYCQGCYKLDFNDLKQYDFTDSLILIDEISLYADNRNFKSFSDDLIYFFKMHRHYNISVVWCSQSYDDADKKIRGVTDTVYLLEPWLFGFSVLKEITHTYNFSNRSISDCYDIAPPVHWKLCYRKKWYQYFDTCEKLKKLKTYKDFQLW